MSRKPSQSDIMRLGPDVAAVKASVRPKRWKQFVQLAHKRGHTVASELSDVPAPLKERTHSSLRREAERTIATAYKPAEVELDRRGLAAKYLNEKRAADDVAYRTWLSGEVEKLDAQASAADATLAAQQQKIADDLGTASLAAQGDSMHRVAQMAGTMSNPHESTALTEQTANADQHTREMVGGAREHSAELRRIGDDSRTMSRGAVLASAAVREATTTADNQKTLAGINADRTELTSSRAKDLTSLMQDLAAREVTKAQNNREYGLAATQLNVKREDIAAKIKMDNKKYRLDQRKIKLEEWKAKHQDAVAQAKVDLGYDQIASREGQKAADRALDKWITKYKVKHGDKKDRTGVTDDERALYRGVETARSTILKIRRNHPDWTDAQIRARLLGPNYGFDSITFDVANDLTQTSNAGALSQRAIAKAKRLGITHVGYFWPQ